MFVAAVVEDNMVETIAGIVGVTVQLMSVERALQRHVGTGPAVAESRVPDVCVRSGPTVVDIEEIDSLRLLTSCLIIDTCIHTVFAYICGGIAFGAVLVA